MARRFVIAALIALFSTAAFAAVDDSRASFFTAYLFPNSTFRGTELSKLGAYFFSIDRNTGALTYELNVGSVDNPARAYVVKNGENPTTIFDLVNDPSQFDSNGRSHGVRTISVVSAQDLIAHPSNYSIYVTDTQGRIAARSPALASAFEYEVPISGHVNGSHGELFVTDLRMFAPLQINPGDPLYAMVEYFPSSTASSGAASTFITGTVSRGTISFDDVVATQLHMPGTTGAMRVTSAKPLTVATRTYNDQRASGRGTLGQFVAAQEHSAALTRGALTALSESLSPLTGYRTNVGFFNANEAPVTVTLDLRDNSGTAIGATTVTLGAFEQRQLALPALFPTVRAVEENVSIAFTSTRGVFVYASVIDNQSSDPYYVEAKQDVPASN
jgi:hypothetical protein